MSINVTVSGNPVRINRGKMVTSYDSAKNEFEKRRLIRLEQVRQQSKDIAENLRNKLKKEKSKCLSEIEKDGEIKLKNWQARKLLELQNQYQEALDEIGLGHKNATQVEDEEEIYVEQQEHNDKIARERGRIASEWLQVEKNEENLKKAKPRQRKIFTNDMENSRTTKIISTQKSKKVKHTAKKAKKDSFDSDSENRVPQLTLDDESSEKSDSSSFEEITRKRSGENTKKQQTTSRISRDQQTSDTNFRAPTSEKAAQTTLPEQLPAPSILPNRSEFPLDTRISERIKRRTKVNPMTDYCDLVDKQTSTCCACCCHPARHQQENVPDVKETKYIVKERFTQKDDKEESVQKLQTVILEDNEGLRNDFDEVIRKSSDIQSKTETLNPVLVEKVSSKTSNTLTIPQKVDDRKPAPVGRTSISFPHRSSDQKATSVVQEFQQSIPAHQQLDQQNTAPQKLDGRRTVPALDKKGDGKFTQNVKSKIPPKPKVTLKSTKDRPVYIGADKSQPVQYYDHPNRFTKTYLPKSSHVETIEDGELIISPNVLSEDEIREKMRQRDIEAHKRGQLALEKEKMQREYRDLLKKLPALQKQERIFEIGADREKYHMARDRLEELEKKRQNKLDNAYEELFVRKPPAVVTLPRRTDDEEKQSLNLANWDVDFDRQNADQNRYETLNHLLLSLKSQKESLLKEIESTLSKETLGQLTKSSSDDVKSKSTDYTRVKRKRSRDDRPTSPTSSDVRLEEEESSETMTNSKKSTIAPSPRKRAKVKSSRKTLVLQNMSTQTTPKTDVQSAATSPIATLVNTCTCTKDTSEDVCEIVIKIKEDEKPEVQVNPPFLGKNIKVVTEPDGKTNGLKKFTSWREQLSHSTGSQSTTSTSYLNPPTKQKRIAKKPAKSPDIEEVSRSINNTVSSKSTPNGKQLDPRLLTYIKKLLKMSRTSIDQLTVSTGSEVSTPSHSVIDAPSNNPLTQLMNVMKYFNIDMAELEKQLSYTSDESGKHYNTKENITVNSQSSNGENSQVKSCSESVTSHEVKESDKKMHQFADIAASYTKKINDLTAKIEKVRAEKKKIMESSSSGSDKDLTTTSYRDLPDKKQDNEECTCQNSLDELLNIDYGYAETLKQLSSQEVQSEKKRTEADQPTDDELLNRLKRLLEFNPAKNVTEKGTTKNARTIIQTEKKLVQESDGDPVGFLSQKKLIESRKHGKAIGVLTENTSVRLKPVETKSDKDSLPLFLDIPKLPKLEVPSLDKKTKRPPPSKGLRAIAAPIEPHELSTIVEADSQLSTKVDSPSKAAKSADVPDIIAEVKSSSDDVSDFDTMETMLISIGMEWAIPTLKKTRQALAMTSSSSGTGSKESGDLSLREFLSKISATKSEEGSSSLSESQGMSLIQVDHRRTSTPIVGDKKEGPVFVTDSDVSSVREISERTKDSEKFHDLNEESLSKTR